MIKKKWIILTIIIYILTGCIKDELPNTEADITHCSVWQISLIRPPEISNDEVKLYTDAWTDVSEVAPEFILTPGATIFPESGTVHNFSRPQLYEVTSEDGKWKKVYTVKIIRQSRGVKSISIGFENVSLYQNKFYHIFQGNDESIPWDTGNEGYHFLHKGNASIYPACQVSDGKIGKCIKLETKDMGVLARVAKKPIASGSLFCGRFELVKSDPKKSTHFGVPLTFRPLHLTGYYKYKAGATFTDANFKEVAGRTDDFAIYAVIFEISDKNKPYLDGYNSLNSPNIILKAIVDNRQQTDEWTEFKAEFKSVGDKKLDKEKLNNGDYGIAIIMSSSVDGGDFLGAVGSTLFVDELKVL